MKNLKILAVFLLCSVSCQQEPIEEYTLERREMDPINDPNKTFNADNKLNQAPNQEMIVKYDAGTTEIQKQILRNQYQVISTKTCRCADPTLELWIVPGAGNGVPTIEDRIHGAKSSSGIEESEGNPDFSITPSTTSMTFGHPDLTIALTKIVPANNNVTIAVMDTGIAYGYFGFNVPFLYDNSNNPMACHEDGMQDYFGWDFVNQDNDPFDDHYNSHGTSVSYIISKTLADNNIAHQILPVKVFNSNGTASYFDILCGYKYAINNSDVDIINMSFGLYSYNSDLLDSFIDESNDKVLITASAGNAGVNTDIVLHYPSGFDTDNIIATAALSDIEQATFNLAEFSNFGPNTIDVAAIGENIPFYTNPNDFVLLSGTSYANAYMSAHAGMMYETGMTIEDHVRATLHSTIYRSNLNQLKYSSYINY